MTNAAKVQLVADTNKANEVMLSLEARRSGNNILVCREIVCEHESVGLLQLVISQPSNNITIL